MKKSPSYRRKKVGKHVYALVEIDGNEIYLGKYGSKASKQKYERLIAEWRLVRTTGQSNSKEIDIHS